MSIKKIKILKERAKKLKMQILVLCKIKKNQSVKKSFEQLDKIEKIHNKLNDLNNEIYDLQQKITKKKGSRKKTRKRTKKKCSKRRSVKRKMSNKEILKCYCSK